MIYIDITHLSFLQPSVQHGLLEDDSEWSECLTEASQMLTGTHLGHLFITILLFCTPSQPNQLLEEFQTHICDDIPYHLCTLGVNNASKNEIYDYGLYIINNILHQSGHSLTDWACMPQLQQQWEQYDINEMIAEQLNYNHCSECTLWENQHQLLNNEQKNAYQRVLQSVHNSTGGMFMINGHGGTGKTFLYKVICSKLRSEGVIVLCTASSGIGALLLPGGHAAHSMFKIHIDTLSSVSVCSIPKNSKWADLM